MVYNYKKQRNPIVPMYSILGSTDDALEKNGGDPKQQIRKVEDTPAPNSYSLPNMVGKTTQSNKRQAPCYFLTGRSNVGSFDEDLSKTPGPGTYNTTDPGVFKNKAPCYSLGGRSWRYGCSTHWTFVPDFYYGYSPGPGTYSPENTPGPGTYNITDPGVFKDKAPCYSLGGTSWRHGYRTYWSFVPNYYNGPGPGAYSPEYITSFRNNSPYYSFGIRHKLPCAPIIVDKPE